MEIKGSFFLSSTCWSEKIWYRRLLWYC